MIYFSLACLGPVFLAWSLWLIQTENMNKTKVRIKVRRDRRLKE